MSVASTSDNFTADRIVWLTRYISIALPMLTLLAGVQIAAYLITRHPDTPANLAIELLYAGALLWARRQLTHRRIGRAVGLACGGLLGFGLLGALISPEMLPMLIQLPLLALIIALPFLSGHRFTAFLLFVLFVTLAIATIGAIRPAGPGDSISNLAVLAATALSTGTILATLVQYHRWFSALLNQSSTANEQLTLARDLLEQQVNARTTELTEREARYRIISGLTSDLIIAFDLTPDGSSRIAWITDAFSQLTGHSLDQIAQVSDLVEIMHPDDRAQAAEHYRRIQDGEAQVWDMRITTASSEQRWMRIYAQPVHDEASGRTTQILAAIKDITTHKQAEEAIRRQAEQRRRMLEAAQLLLSGRSLDEISYWVGDVLKEILHYDEFGIFWVDPEQALLNPIWFNDRAWRITSPTGFRLKIGEGISGQVAQTGTPQLANNAHLNPLSLYPKGFYPPVDHLIALPLQTDDHVVGTLCINRYTDPPFQQEEFEDALLFGSILSVALTNTRLLDQMRASEQKYRRLFEESIDVIYISTPAGQVLDINPAGLELLGYTRDEMLALDVARDLYVDPRERAEFARIIAEYGSVRGLASRRRRKDGRIIYVEENASAVRDEQGTILAYQGYLRDVTERKLVEEQLHQKVIALQRRSSEITTLNSMGEHFQTSRSEREACSVAGEVLHQLFPTTSGAIYLRAGDAAPLQQVRAWGGEIQFHVDIPAEPCWARRAAPGSEGASIACSVCMQAITQGTGTVYCQPIRDQGELAGMVMLGSPLGEPLSHDRRNLLETAVRPLELAITNLRLRETLTRQAIRDPLTSLYNRRYMEESLLREMHRVARRAAPLGIIMLDLDHFKRVNDLHGHAAGDTLLRELGRFLLVNIRAEDIACRYGGEEFLLILPESSLDDTRRRAEQICIQARELIVQHQHVLIEHITVSIGVAAYPLHGTNVEELLYEADMALYRAKAQGRNQVVIAQGGASSPVATTSTLL